MAAFPIGTLTNMVANTEKCPNLRLTDFTFWAEIPFDQIMRYY